MNNLEFSPLSTIEINVKGMTCGHCKMKVEKAISQIEGVAGVEVDLIDASAEIKYSGNIDLDIVAQKVEEAGFSLVR